ADDKQTWNGFRSSPIDCLKARILKAAEHHEREKKHEWRQNEFPFSEVMFTFGQPEQKKSDGCDETGSSGNREAGEIFFVIGIGRFVIGGRGVEACQPQRTACQINERDDPTGARKFL